jgi:hypothetical protein
MKRLLVVVLALVLAALALSAPAQAVGRGSVTGIDGVLYDDCLDYDYRYQVLVPEGVETWYLEVEARGPDGRVSDTDFVDRPDPTGVSTFFLCSPPVDRYGTYTIHATFTWVYSSNATGSEVFPDANFTLRKPFTRTRLSVSTRRPAFGQLVTYRIMALDERPAGYLPTAFTWVHLEKRRDGHWVRVRGSRALTHANGRVKVRIRYLHHHHRMRIRAITERTPKLRRSVSPVVRLW